MSANLKKMINWLYNSCLANNKQNVLKKGGRYGYGI